jgi:hypothetical protein
MTQGHGGYERPDEVRDPDDERADGRATGGSNGDAARPPEAGSGDAPTEAIEEQGGDPTTEHAPGADL